MPTYRDLQWDLCDIEKKMAAMERRSARLGIPVEMLEDLDRGVREVDKRIDRQMRIDGSCPHPHGSPEYLAWFEVRRAAKEQIKVAARASFRHDFILRAQTEKAKAEAPEPRQIERPPEE